jgi:hypothetical protein
MSEEVGIVVTGEDRGASAVLKRVGETGANSFGKMKQSIKQMPEQFGKMSGALLLFRSGMGQAGGKVADAANKISALVGLIAVGGPLGIAIAGATALVAAGAAVWDTYTEETRRAEDAQRSVERALAASATRILDVKNNLQDLTAQVTDYGKETLDVALTKQRELIAANEMGLASLEAEIEGIEFTTRAFYKANSAQAQHLKNLLKIRDNSRAMLGLRKQELAQLEALQQLQASDKATEAEKKQAEDRKRRADEWQRQEATAEQERIRRANKMAALTTQIDTGITNMRIANLTRMAQLETQQDEEARRRLEERQALEEATMAQSAADQMALAQTVASGAGTAAASWGNAFALMATGQESASKAMGNAAIDTAQTAIMTAAASAAAKQLEAHSYLPFVGIAIGTAFAGAVFAAAKSYMSKFQFGGVVTGGTPNLDSVPALLTPGERVLTKQEREGYESREKQQPVVNNITIAPSYGLMDAPSSKSQRRKLVLDLAQDMEEASRDGQLKLARVGT